MESISLRERINNLRGNLGHLLQVNHEFAECLKVDIAVGGHRCKMKLPHETTYQWGLPIWAMVAAMLAPDYEVRQLDEPLRELEIEFVVMEVGANLIVQGEAPSFIDDLLAMARSQRQEEGGATLTFAEYSLDYFRREEEFLSGEWAAEVPPESPERRHYYGIWLI